MNHLEETVNPCKCGNEDLIIWLEDLSLSPEESLTNLEKIECLSCGAVVYGGGEEEVKQWNEQRYDD